mmetsp:Transcript_69483/g.148644  ORF Transcript_69483/g.148644 Transcript_69483/m.148644 type:complete len:212 (-) Transcript_69483:562-1197(-)
MQRRRTLPTERCTSMTASRRPSIIARVSALPPWELVSVIFATCWPHSFNFTSMCGHISSLSRACEGRPFRPHSSMTSSVKAKKSRSVPFCATCEAMGSGNSNCLSVLPFTPVVLCFFRSSSESFNNSSALSMASASAALWLASALLIWIVSLTIPSSLAKSIWTSSDIMATLRVICTPIFVTMPCHDMQDARPLLASRKLHWQFLVTGPTT